MTEDCKKSFVLHFNTCAAFFRMVLGLVSLKTCRFWGISTSGFSDKSPFPRGQVLCAIVLSWQTRQQTCPHENGELPFIINKLITNQGVTPILSGKSFSLDKSLLMGDPKHSLSKFQPKIRFTLWAQAYQFLVLL